MLAYLKKRTAAAKICHPISAETGIVVFLHTLNRLAETGFTIARSGVMQKYAKESSAVYWHEKYIFFGYNDRNTPLLGRNMLINARPGAAFCRRPGAAAGSRIRIIALPAAGKRRIMRSNS
ncbi:hypothetical protein [Eikenella longinqua]|uniref:hypothetical protein n=2 Tax=Eikenella TaxID=538 RepID=UPI0012E93091|nr:hypothetical protein [Eikenella longinqua]